MALCELAVTPWAHDVRRALSSKWAGYIFHARDFIGSSWEPNTITHRESGLSYFSPIYTLRVA